jgi:TolB-like protein/Flp pilus assembly protein TadD
MASVWEELKRRNVVKVALAYAIVAWLLIEISATLLPAFEAPKWILRVVILLVGIGFVLAIILSWAFELTPQGVLRTDDVPKSESVANETGQKLNFLIIAALVLALGFVVVDNYVLDNSGEAAIANETATPEAEPLAEESSGVMPNSVAVLLCDNLSPNADDAYFAASIHEEILNQLVKISSMNVIARTSVLQYADAQLPIPQIAAELNVGAVMECSVRFAGTAIMVTAQLIDPETNSHLWSETYPGDLSDLSAIFAMQADIAMNIANALQAEFSSAEQERIGKQATVSAEAYTLYLRAISGGGGPTRIRLLDEAIALDPEFALAYALKAETLVSYINFGINGRAGRARQEPRAIESAERALLLDPTLATAQLALADLHALNWRRVAAENAYIKALELNPNDPEVLGTYSRFKRNTGEYPEAIRLSQIAVTLDPNAGWLWHQLGINYSFAGDNDAAFRAVQNALALEPDSMTSLSELTMFYLARGDTAAAKDTLRAVDEESLEAPIRALWAWRAMRYERVGLQPAAERCFAKVEELVGASSTGNVSLATAYVAIHEYDKAYDELERAISGSEPLETAASIELKANRWDHPVLNEPRFVELRNKLGFQD